MTTATTQDATITAAIAWLEDQFPGWSVSVADTQTGSGARQPIWIARREDHHPQAALSPAKLHSRLSDYMDRYERRHSFGR